MRVLKGHTDAVLCVAYAPDGKTLATGAMDGTVRLWDAATGKEKAVLRGHRKSVYAVAFSLNGKLLASGGGGMALRLWDAATGKRLAILKGHTAVVKCLALRRTAGPWSAAPATCSCQPDQGKPFGGFFSGSKDTSPYNSLPPVCYPSPLRPMASGWPWALASRSSS